MYEGTFALENISWSGVLDQPSGSAGVLGLYAAQVVDHVIGE